MLVLFVLLSSGLVASQFTVHHLHNLAFTYISSKVIVDGDNGYNNNSNKKLYTKYLLWFVFATGCGFLLILVSQ